MHVEVDQSGKINDTRVDTILAFANGERYAIVIPAGVKRAALQALRSQGDSGPSLYLHLFCAGLYLLLREHILRIELVTIDMEYPGQEARVGEHLLNLLRRAGLRVPTGRIAFGYIGKRSPAHLLAYDTFLGTVQAHRRVTLGELLEACR